MDFSCNYSEILECKINFIDVKKFIAVVIYIKTFNLTKKNFIYFIRDSENFK